MARNNLFELIKTMNSGEKRAFKLFAQRYSKKVSVYVKLFDFVDKIDSYNIEYVKSKFVRPNKLEKQFPVIKNKLFQLILASLRNKYQEKYTPFGVSKHFEEAVILMNRGLFKAALSYLEKAEKACRESDSLLMLLKVLERKTDVYLRILKADEFQLKVQEIIERKNNIRDSLMSEYRLEQIYHEVYHLFRTSGTANTEEKKQEYRNKLQKHQTELGKTATTIKAKHFQYLINTIFHYCVLELDESVSNALAHIEFLEQHPVFLEENINEYLKALNNCITIYIARKKFAEAQQLIEKVEALRYSSIILNRFIEQRIFEIKYASKLAIAVNTKNTEQGFALADDINRGLDKYKNVGLSIDRNIRLNFGLSLIYFWKNEWLSCLDHINTIEKIEQETSGGPTFIVGYAKILAAIAHFELGNEQLAESLLQNTKRYLSKIKRLFPAEKITLKYLNKLLYTVWGKQKGILEQFNKELNAEREKDPNNILFSTIYLQDWLDRRRELA